MAYETVTFIRIKSNLIIGMNVFMLVVTIIGCILSVIVNLYLIIIYTHKQQSRTRPANILAVIVVFITLAQAEFQPLFLLFDCISSRNNTNSFNMMWYVLYFSILVNIAFLKPLVSSLYEADEEDPCWKIVLWSIIEVIITLAAFGIFLGVGWLFWGKTYIPITEISVLDQYNPNAQIVQTITDSNYLQMKINVPCYLIGLLCLIGYPVLACCGACGMTALPFSLIMEFKNRPKWIRTNQARAITQELKKQTVGLIKEADMTRRALNRVDYIDGWFSQRKKNQQLDADIGELENKTQKLCDFYELFRLELDMANVNPWVYFFKLVAGIFCMILTPLWLVQILLCQLVYKKSIFLDKFLVLMEENNASFVSVTFILILTFYMILATIKGIFFVSESIPFFTLHPMREGRTWLNSFMFQATVAVLASTSMMHLLVSTFPQYLRGGDIAVMMGSIMTGMLFVGVFIYHKVFVYIFLIMSVLGSFFVGYKMFCVNHKSEAALRMEEIRKKLFDKDKQNNAITIEMTEMNLKSSRKKEEKNESKTKPSKSKGITVEEVGQATSTKSKQVKKSKRKVKLQFQ